MREIRPRLLDADAFAPFGEVIEASDRARRLPINHGWTDRFDDLARIDVSDDDGRPCVSIFRSRPLNPLVLKLFERHPLGSQAFVPLTPYPFLVAVAPPGPFDPAAVQVFMAIGKGVNYAKGVWRHFCLAQAGVSDFLVIDRAGPGENLEEVELAPADQIRVRL